MPKISIATDDIKELFPEVEYIKHLPRKKKKALKKYISYKMKAVLAVYFDELEEEIR